MIAGDPLLRWVGRWTALAGAALVAGSVAFDRLDVTLGAVVGVAVTLANLVAGRWLARRMISGGARGRAAASTLFGLKLMLMIGALYLLLSAVPMDTSSLLLGLSVVVVVIVAGAFVGPRPDSMAGVETLDG